MINDPHFKLESAFFEFCKMKAFLENGVTKRVGNIQLVPIKEAQEYVHSLLIVDLISVFKQGVDHFFKHLNLKQVKGKSKFTVLEENGHVKNPRYLEWYVSWRNSTAHEFARPQYHHLAQATKDVGIQFEEWGLISPRLKFWPYEVKVANTHYKTGSQINKIPILEFEVWSDNPDSSSSRKTIDLSWGDFKEGYKDVIDKIQARN